MFGDFMTLAADQLINHASKFRYMYNDQVELPLSFAHRWGAARLRPDAQPEPGEALPGPARHADDRLAPTAYDPGLLYDALLASIDRPTIVIENKLLYGLRVGDAAPEGFALEHTDELFPTTRLRPEAEPDVTILCYGGMLPEVEKAARPLFDVHEVACEVICPAQLYPLDPWPLIESVRRTAGCWWSRKGIGFAGFGAEIVAQLVEHRPGRAAHAAPLAAPSHPIPLAGRWRRRSCRARCMSWRPSGS